MLIILYGSTPVLNIMEGLNNILMYNNQHHSSAYTHSLHGRSQLLLEEISGLEQQVATFRGYADQRHVTVLALRDERQRSREIVSELVTLGDTAAAISHLVSTGVYTHEQKHQRQQQPQHQQHPRCESRPAGGDAAASSSLGSTNSKKTSGSSLFSGHGVGAGQAQRTFVASATSSEMLMASPSGTLSASGHGERITKISPGAGTPAAQHNNNIYQGPEEEVPEGEKHSLKAIRKALSDALAELDRRGEALKAERGAKSEVEGRIREAENVARAAEERGLAAEANVGKLKGRISVLERNVEYLQSQERGLRYASFIQVSWLIELVEGIFYFQDYMFGCLLRVGRVG